ncbi:hypothetical protein QE250_08535 [Chromatiaceae bacterium AAb-1]|nr:hypothetical protein [Chromatiaceae bacterium AAb-1]
MLSLEPAITAYIKALNTLDHQSALYCFDPEAVVLEKNRIWAGHTAIKRWQRQYSQSYIIEVVTAQRHQGETYLQARLQTSPETVEFRQYVFALQDGKISRLIVQLENYNQ